MKSVISFPDRGPWGKSSWRGNCSGHVIKELIDHFKPSTFVDVCEGSGTSREVCRDLGVSYYGFDLHSGTDFTSNYILSLLPSPCDIVFSHPPYDRIVDYGTVGTFSDSSLIARDTSRCQSTDEFLEKSRIMLLNQREATRPNGHYCSLIGDTREKGVFRSLQADFLNMMPKSENIGVVIKTQHNTLSDKKVYGGTFIPILHEYLLVWKKSSKTLVQVSFESLKEANTQTAATWRSLVRLALMKLGGTASLSDIYAMVEQEASDRIKSNANWMAKIRQTLQYHFDSVTRGIWSMPEAA